jgi:prevent-host-death family protein
MVYRVNIHEAKTHFSRLIERAQAGEEVIVARAGRDVARIVPIRTEVDRRPGAFKGRIHGDFTGPSGTDHENDWG